MVNAQNMMNNDKHIHEGALNNHVDQMSTNDGIVKGTRDAKKKEHYGDKHTKD